MYGENGGGNPPSFHFFHVFFFFIFLHDFLKNYTREPPITQEGGMKDLATNRPTSGEAEPSFPGGQDPDALGGTG